MTQLDKWLVDTAARDQQLYQQYGKPLEGEHKGEYVAIAADGKTILGARAAEVLQQAVETFGSGNFALKRVGYRTFGKWLTATK
jgi:hypothetical protein